MKGRRHQKKEIKTTVKVKSVGIYKILAIRAYKGVLHTTFHDCIANRIGIFKDKTIKSSPGSKATTGFLPQYLIATLFQSRMQELPDVRSNSHSLQHFCLFPDLPAEISSCEITRGSTSPEKKKMGRERKGKKFLIKDALWGRPVAEQLSSGAPLQWPRVLPVGSWARTQHRSSGHAEAASHAAHPEALTTRIYNYVLGSFGEKKTKKKRNGLQNILSYQKRWGGSNTVNSVNKYSLYKKGGEGIGRELHSIRLFYILNYMSIAYLIKNLEESLLYMVELQLIFGGRTLYFLGQSNFFEVLSSLEFLVQKKGEAMIKVRLYMLRLSHSSFMIDR